MKNTIETMLLYLIKYDLYIFVTILMQNKLCIPGWQPLIYIKTFVSKEYFLKPIEDLSAKST